MIRRTHTTRRDGLTLLEVLLALAILLISLAAIASLVDFGASLGVRAAMQSAGTRLAQSKLAEAEAGAVPLTGGGESGTFEAEPEWSYTLESTAAGPANVFAVTVTASRDYAGERYEVTLTQLVCDPAVMSTAAEAKNPSKSSQAGLAVP